MKNKMIIGLVMVLYALSLLAVPALAQEDNDSDDMGEVEESEDRAPERLRHRDRAIDARERAQERARDRAEEARERAQERLENAREKAEDRLERAREKAEERRERMERRAEIAIEKREVAQERLERARERYEEARERAAEARQRYEERRSDFASARSRLEDCEEDCDELEEQVNAEARDYLLSAIDRMVNKLEQTQARIEGSEVMTEEEVSDATAETQRVIDRLEELRSRVEEATGKDEIQALGREVRRTWSASEDDIKEHSYNEVGRRVGLIINQAHLLETRLDCAVGRLNASGNTSADIEDRMTEFDNLLESARTHFAESRNATEAGNFDAAKEAIKDGHDDLKAAHRLSVDILKMVREAGGSIAGCTAEFAKSRPENVRPRMDDDMDDSDDDSDVNETEGNETEVEEEFRVRVRGNLNLTNETQSTLDELVASFEGVPGEHELRLNVTKSGNSTVTDAEVHEGNLTANQTALWEELQSQVEAIVASGPENSSIRIRIEHELEVEMDDDMDESDDDVDETEENETEEREVEIEVEIRNGTSTVEVEIDDEEMTFELETTDREEIISEIVDRTDLTREEVEEHIEFESED